MELQSAPQLPRSCVLRPSAGTVSSSGAPPIQLAAVRSYTARATSGLHTIDCGSHIVYCQGRFHTQCCVAFLPYNRLRFSHTVHCRAVLHTKHCRRGMHITASLPYITGDQRLHTKRQPYRTGPTLLNHAGTPCHFHCRFSIQITGASRTNDRH